MTTTRPTSGFPAKKNFVILDGGELFLGEELSRSRIIRSIDYKEINVLRTFALGTLYRISEHNILQCFLAKAHTTSPANHKCRNAFALMYWVGN